MGMGFIHKGQKKMSLKKTLSSSSVPLARLGAALEAVAPSFLLLEPSPSSLPITSFSSLHFPIHNTWKNCSFFLVHIVLVLVSWGCCNKLSWTWGLTTTEIYSLRVLEIRSPKSALLAYSQWMAQGWSFWSLQGRIHFIAFPVLPVAVSGLWFVITPISASVVPSLWSLPLPFSYKDCIEGPPGWFLISRSLPNGICKCLQSPLCLGRSSTDFRA